ncbi:MAG: hypothetical protein KAT00_07320, partial [Planctomycetes bacterium]|nr:hypothetical protein [Planctomycetota bacterium]
QTVDLMVRSTLDYDLTVGDVTLPSHDPAHRQSIDPWIDPSHSRTKLKIDQFAVCDKIIARGGPIKVCGTFTNTQFSNGWTSTLETAYKNAANGVTGYADLEESEKAALNDRYRATDKFSKVYTTFIVDKDWDWTIGSNNANPKWYPASERAELVPAENANYWNVGKRFYPFVPFKEGVDYSGSSPSVENVDGVEADWRRMFVILKDSDGKYCYAEKNDQRTGTVRPLTTELGVEVRIRPQYLLGKTEFTSAEPGLWDLDMADYSFDPDDMEFTAFCETDQIFQISHQVNTTETNRTLVIDVPEAELWYVVPGTVVDIEDDGTKITYGSSADHKIRDDTDRLKKILAAAVAWYGRARYKVNITQLNITDDVTLGELLEYIDITNQDGDEAGAIISSISTDFQTQRMVISTDFSELDFAGIYGSATGKNPPATPSLKVAAREIARLDKETTEIKRELGRSPVRVEQATPGSGGGGVRMAYVKTTPGAVSTVDCYLDTDGTGDEVTVTCSIAGGSQLNSAIPRIADGDLIYIAEIDGSWVCLTTFQTTEDCDCS